MKVIPAMWWSLANTYCEASMSLRLIRRITFFLAAVAAVQVQASGPGFSGLFAKADNAETVFFNPAGMGLLEGNQMTLQGLVVNSFSSFHVNKAKTTAEGGNPRNQDPVLICDSGCRG